MPEWRIRKESWLAKKSLHTRRRRLDDGESLLQMTTFCRDEGTCLHFGLERAASGARRVFIGGCPQLSWKGVSAAWSVNFEGPGPCSD